MKGINVDIHEQLCPVKATIHHFLQFFINLLGSALAEIPMLGNLLAKEDVLLFFP